MDHDLLFHSILFPVFCFLSKVYYETTWQGCPDTENIEELELSLLL